MNRVKGWLAQDGWLAEMLLGRNAVATTDESTSRSALTTQITPISCLRSVWFLFNSCDLLVADNKNDSHHTQFHMGSKVFVIRLRRIDEYSSETL